MLAILSFVVVYIVLSGVLQIGAVAIDVARGRVASGDLLQGKLTLTPVLLLSVNLTNALSIPLVMLLQWGFFGQSPRWIHSVLGQFRWRLLARSALIVLPIWVLYVAFSLVVMPDQPGSGLSGESIVMLVIVLFTTPLQAAGEEYAARGLLTRAAASWVGGPRASLALGTLVSSALFMVAHGAGDPWLIVFYFLFGVGLSVVTWRTGGLEVAVLIHSVNNLVAFGIPLLSGQDVSNALNRSDGTGGPAVLLPMVILAAVVAGIWWWAGRTKVVDTFVPGQPSLPNPPIAAV
jgi:membrane protease YdiL (CAAX protease family)